MFCAFFFAKKKASKNTCIFDRVLRTLAFFFAKKKHQKKKHQKTREKAKANKKRKQRYFFQTV
jgi:hypothetical protein